MALHRDLVLHGLEKLAQAQDVTAERNAAGNYTVTIETSSEAVVMSLEVLRLVMLLTGRIYTAVDRAKTDYHSQEQVRALREKEKAVAEQYWCYRDQGFGHRKAIEATVQISEVCRNMQWTKTDVGYCVRNYPREYFALNEPRKEVTHGE